MCARFSFMIIGVCRYFLSVVVECPDLLLTFSLFATDKQFLCYVLDIVSVFFGKLVIDIVEHHLMIWLLQCLLQCLPASWLLMVALHSMVQ